MLGVIKVTVQKLVILHQFSSFHFLFVAYQSIPYDTTTPSVTVYSRNDYSMLFSA